MRRGLPLLCLLLIAAIAAGCGSDDDDPAGGQQAEVPVIGEEPEDVNPAQPRLLRSDREAEVATRTAATAVETYGVEMGGTYAGIDLASLQEIDPTIPATVEFRPKAGGYSVTVPSKASGNRFTVEKRAGALEYICSSPGKGDCPKDGDWAP